MKEILTVTSLDSALRLDVFVAKKFPEWSRTRLQRFIEEGRILVDGKPVTTKLKLKADQVVEVTWPEAQPPKISKVTQPLPPIVFEDEYLLAVNKPAGLVVHPAAGHFDGNTLSEILSPKLERGAWPDEVRPGLVHRLDRDTSGLILFAKTPEIQTSLSRQFAQRQVKKTYMALVKGKMKSKEGTLECRISRHPGMRQRFAVSSTGRWALTKFLVKDHLEMEKNNRPFHITLVELHPLTGRTHQLRVQLAGIKRAILGDHVYGDAQDALEFIKRQMLHASDIEFKHPKKDRIVKLSAPLPEDFQEALKLIRLN